MPRWPSPDPNSWANPRGRKKGKGTTSKARQLRKATSPRVLAKRAKKAEEEAAAAAASSAQPLQQGGQAATQAEPLQQGEKAATQTEPLQQGEKPATGAEPLQEGKKAEKAATQAEPLQQGDKAATQAEPLQQGDKAATQAQPLQQGEKAEKAATKPEPLQQGEKEEEKEEVWETALGKRARSLQKRKAKQWQVKEAPLPEGKPLQQGEAKAKSRPASSAKGKRKTDVGYVPIGSDSGSSTQPSPSRSSSTRGSRQPLKQGTPATPREKGTLETRVKLVEKKKVLCLDWHNVFQIQDEWSKKDIVPDLHINRVWDLQAEGWEVHILSYCGKRRAHEFHSWASSLPLKFASVRTCNERTGKWGKTSWAKWLGCTHLVDDNRSICQEALEEGLEVLPVVSEWEPHIWYWGKPCQNFSEAVDRLLLEF